MQQTNRDLVRKAFLALGIAVLAAAFVQRALQNLAHIDYRNSNFVFFWLAGRMVCLGQNPYDAPQWLAQHVINNVAWRSDPVFSYPLPLAILLSPLGLLPLESAYVAWQLLTLAVLAGSVWLILRSSGARHLERLFFPMVLALLFFGPVYLTVQIGGIGALTLGAMTAAILALEKRREYVAGALLSLVLLKPSQGIPILLLGGIWLLFQASWKGIFGLAVGSLALLLTGLILEPTWPAVFLSSAQDLIPRNLGLHSNVFSIARDLCAPGGRCTWILGGAAAVFLDAATLAYLWRRRNLTQLAAFSFIIPVAFITAVYAWSYDQILYVIPIAWVAGQLSRSPRGYLAAFAFTVLVVTVSLVALALHAYTGTDVLSSITTLVVLAGVGLALTKAPLVIR
jgi:hypothetical protein